MTKAMTQFLQVFIEGLKDAGVQEVVLSPGSRSTPLAILFQQHADFTCWMDVDERSAAFFGLGISKVSQRPVVCVCTSGTAAANYFPAICEAQESNIPLIILTTDRPHELRHVGAPQTMNQIHLYGDKVKFFVELPLGENSSEMLQYSYAQAFQLVQRALGDAAGPVHANFAFREPLIPDSQVEVPVIRKKQFISGFKQLNQADLTSIAKQMNHKKGWLVIGDTNNRLDQDLIIAVAEKLQWPIFADPLANIRSNGKECSSVVSHYDLLFKQIELHPELQPEIVIRIGRAPISKSLNQQLSQLAGDYFYIDETSQIKEYSHRATHILEVNPNQFLAEILKKLVGQSTEWLEKWQELDNQIQLVIQESDFFQEYSEGKVVAELLKHIPSNAQLFLSNSMPIRDVDTLLNPLGKRLDLYGNRGVNGIDGIVSTAFGMTTVDPEKWNGLLIGDLSFFHDMNGTSLGKMNHLPLTIIVINNNGGGIFSMLPQQQLAPEIFEQLFGTPLDLDFEKVARIYACDYFKVTNLTELEQTMKQITEQPKFRIVEIMTNRDENLRMHKELNQLVSKQLNWM